MAHIPVVFLVITKLIAFSKGYILCGTKRSPKMNGDKNNNLFSMVLRSFNCFLFGKVNNIETFPLRESLLSSYGHVVRDFESEAKTR